MASNRYVDPFRQTWSQRLAASWRLAALAAVLMAVVAVAARTLTAASTRVEARLVRFGSYATDAGSLPLLIVRLSDGTDQQVRVRRSDVRACRVDSTIHLMRRGSLLTLAPGGCIGPAKLPHSPRELVGAAGQ